MLLTRFVAALLLSQGAMPAIVHGVSHGGWMYLVALSIYAWLAWGAWTGRRWALMVASGLTLLQVFVIATASFTWYFLMGTALGIGLAPVPGSILDWGLLGYRTLGAALFLSVGEGCAPVHSEFATEGPFVLVNLFAAMLLVLLFIALHHPAATTVTHAENSAAIAP